MITPEAATELAKRDIPAATMAVKIEQNTNGHVDMSIRVLLDWLSVPASGSPSQKIK